MSISPETAPFDASYQIEAAVTAKPHTITSNSFPAETAVVPDKIVGYSTSFEVYEPLRNLLIKRENEFNLILSFFSEKLNIENNFIKANEALLKKYSTLRLSNGKSTSLALSSFMDYHMTQYVEQMRYRDQITKVIQNLEDLKKTIDTLSRQIKDMVKPVARKYTEMASVNIPRFKTAYFKKSENSGKESGDALISGQKLFKLNKEAEHADSAYRHAIEELEDVRINMELAKQKASTMWELMERQRGEFLLTCFTSLSKSLDDSHARLVEKLRIFAANSKCISFQEDCKLASDYFQLAFPEREPILYEHYKTKESAKDLIFGVSLEHALRTSSKNGIPLLLYKCFEAIEARGLEIQGIYRISGKKYEILELKTKAESNVHSIPYMQEELSIHLLAGLVKLYLRELPTPILPFMMKDRKDYSANPITEQRLQLLCSKIESLSKNNRTLLESVVNHLQKVCMKSSINKMTVSNLSLIFSAVLFQGQDQIMPEVSSMSSMLFGKPATTDIVTLDILKSDLVVEDLIKYADHVFRGAPFTPWAESSQVSSAINSLPPTYVTVQAEVADGKDELPPLPSKSSDISNKQGQDPSVALNENDTQSTTIPFLGNISERLLMNLPGRASVRKSATTQITATTSISAPIIQTGGRGSENTPNSLSECVDAPGLVSLTVPSQNHESPSQKVNPVSDEFFPSSSSASPKSTRFSNHKTSRSFFSKLTGKGEEKIAKEEQRSSQYNRHENGSNESINDRAEKNTSYFASPNGILRSSRSSSEAGPSQATSHEKSQSKGEKKSPLSNDILNNPVISEKHHVLHINQSTKDSSIELLGEKSVGMKDKMKKIFERKESDDVLRINTTLRIPPAEKFNGTSPIAVYDTLSSSPASAKHTILEPLSATSPMEKSPKELAWSTSPNQRSFRRIFTSPQQGSVSNLFDEVMSELATTTNAESTIRKEAPKNLKVENVNRMNFDDDLIDHSLIEDVEANIYMQFP